MEIKVTEQRRVDRLVSGEKDPEWFTEFYGRLSSQSPAEVDEYAHAHDQAFIEYASEHEDFRAVIHGFLRSFTYRLTPANAAFRILKSAQAMEMGVMGEHHDSFPRGYDSLEAWTEVFDRVVADRNYQSSYMMNLLLPVASNVPERGKLLKAVSLLHGNNEPEVMEVGCSLRHNLRLLALSGTGEMDYRDVEVVDAQRQIAMTQTEAFNNLVHSTEFGLGESLGVDLWDADKDPRFAEWAKSNSFYMPELLEPSRVEQFTRLAEARLSQIGFMNMDATSTSDAEKVGRRYDIVYFCTMLYQLGGKSVEKALDNAHQWVKPRGLIVVQDFADFGPGGAPEFYPKEEWGSWRYNVWVKDMARRRQGFQKYLTAENGRARRVMLQPALGELAVAEEVGLAVA